MSGARHCRKGDRIEREVVDQHNVSSPQQYRSVRTPALAHAKKRKIAGPFSGWPAVEWALYARCEQYLEKEGAA